MKSKKFWLVMLVLVLAFGMTVVGCDDDDSDDSETSTTVDNNGDPSSGTTGNTALTGTVSITGTAMEEQILTANTTSLGGSGTISYQWKRNGTTNIGTNSSTYEIQNADIGSTITVTVTRSGYSGSVTSAATATVVANTLPELTGSVTITGTAKVGQTLTVNTTSLDGTGTISYQWKRGNSSSAAGTNITDATASTYTLVAADESKYITVTVTRAGYAGSVTSSATTAVADIMSWTQVSQSIFSSSTSINSIAYNGTNLWVAVGGSIIASSADGITWSTEDYVNLSGTTFNSVAYYNNRWIAVGSNAGMYTSTTGKAPWSKIDVSSIFGNNGALLTISDITASQGGQSRWVAIGSGRAGWSTNGTTWTAVDDLPAVMMTTTKIAVDTISNSYHFVLVGGKRLATSVLGSSWNNTPRDLSNIFTGSQNIQTVAYGNNRWVVAGTGGIMANTTASDGGMGSTWTLVTGNQFGNGTIRTVAYGNNKWAAAGSESSSVLGIDSGSRIAFSTDGVNWASVANTAFGSNQVNSIAFGGGKWVAVGANGRIAYANDN